MEITDIERVEVIEGQVDTPVIECEPEYGVARFDGNGAPGAPGKSAYEIWLDNGNTGTQEQFLASLKGADGTDGINGTPGKSAYEIWLDNGNTGTQAQFLASLKGADGVNGTDGTNGAPGKSAYEIWLDSGYTGTQAQFLASLKGADGVNGTDGTDGTPGKSAYEIWLDNGNTGTQEQFLASLKGADGADGASCTSCTANIELNENRLYLTVNGIRQGDGVELPESTVSSFGSKLRLINGMPSREITVIEGDAPANIAFTVTSTDTDTNEPTGDITLSWYVSGNRVYTGTAPQGEQTFNVRPYLTGKTTALQLVCEDSYGNSKTLTWTVTTTAFMLDWNLPESISLHSDQSIALNLIPRGTGAKVIHVTIDGKTIFESPEITSSGQTTTTIIPAQPHGAHTIEAWLTTTVNGEPVSTPPLRHVGVWVDSDSTTPIVAVYDLAPTISQYGTANIPYFVYDPQHEPATATLSIDGNTVATVAPDRTMQLWSYRGDTVGTVDMAISCGGVTAPMTLTVGSLGYDIAPVRTGLVLDIDPAGHSNSEAGAKTFGYIEYDFATGAPIANHPFTYSPGFDWVNGGFKQDDDGVTAFVIKRGDHVELDRSFFSDNAKTNGKELKIVFRTTECRDYDTEILTCKANNVGLKMQANQATFSSSVQSRVIPYCEESKIEMDINIESVAENKIATVWLEGVPARCFAYTDDEWVQNTPELVRIGSAQADVWLYRVKMYASSLPRTGILANFVADCSDTDEMLARYHRNDIFTDGELDLEKLAAAAPNLRIVHISADRMTTGKSDKVPCSVSLTYGADHTKDFTATGIKDMAQGTSSLEYGEAALNHDLDFSEAATWICGGENITEYAMTDDSIPMAYFNIKLNVASSENANNVCLADDYDAYQPFLSAMKTDDSRVRDTVEGHPCAVFFTNTSASTVMAGARSVAPGETILYGCGDFNNSKKNFDVFGQTSSYPDLCCVEILNNNNPQCLFQSDDLTDEAWDGDGNFEFRYPKSPTQAMKDRWQALLSWVVSTDRAAATGTPLDSPITYGGMTYAADSAAYRLAKFRAEAADHFDVDSLLYHYLFTERHCMVDNRAKNTFCSYEPNTEGIYRWNFCKDYDNDTAEGNDNSGGLTFTYGLEDTDMVGAAYVFNAHDSVLWCNVRDGFPDELATMYRDREAAGAWDAYRIIAKFEAYQSARPEALIAEDMWGKYYTPYINNGQARYLGIMLGSKSDQRRQFELYQERYMAAKYAGAVATADRITLRTNSPQGVAVPANGDITGIVPYADTYIRIRYGNAGEVLIRAKKGQPYIAECPAATLNDTETYIYGGSMIASLGSLAALYTKLFSTSYDVAGRSAPTFKLRQLLLSSPEEGYANTTFSVGIDEALDLSKIKFAERLDLRGLTAFNKPLNLAEHTSLEEIYTTDSSVTGITFGRGARVRTALLNPVAALVALDLTKLAAFEMSGSDLTKLWIENCPAIDTAALIAEATGLTRLRVTDVDWELSAAETEAIYGNTINAQGMTAAGDDAADFILTGDMHISATIDSGDIIRYANGLTGLTISLDGISDAYLADGEAIVDSGDALLLSTASADATDCTAEQLCQFVADTLATLAAE